YAANAAPKRSGGSFIQIPGFEVTFRRVVPVSVWNGTFNWVYVSQHPTVEGHIAYYEIYQPPGSLSHPISALGHISPDLSHSEIWIKGNNMSFPDLSRSF
ncbi:hypothetical protein IFM5058_05470, partial [Aspergillus udagawae]